jgi:dodecin
MTTGGIMSDHTYRVIEVVGSSSTSSDDALKRAIADASKTLRNIRWFNVVDTRGQVVDGKVAHFQVTVKIGFTLDDR